LGRIYEAFGSWLSHNIKEKSMAKNLTAALALVGASAAASATPITISETISLSQLLSGGATSTISFDLTSQLATAGQTPGGVQSGDLVVFGYSDAQYNSTAADPYSGYNVSGSSSHGVQNTYTYYSYCSSWSWSCYSGPFTGYYYSNVNDYEYTRTRDVHHIDATADTMQVSAGGSSATGSASTHSTGVGGSTTYFDGQGGSYYGGYTYYYSRDRDVYEAISGPLQATVHLDSVALADLNADGMLSATVNALLGSFHLTSASLNVLSEARAADVPEPGTLALLAVAAVGGAAARRRKKK
jgi:hypothetical protein